MDCTTCKKLMSEYSAGMFGGAKEADLTEHIAACAFCNAELTKLQSVMALVEGLDSREPPVGLWNGVYNSITSQTHERERFGRKLGRIFHRASMRWSLGFVTAALTVLLMIAHIHSPAPVTSDAYTTEELMQGHVVYSSQDVLSDQVALNSAAALDDRDQAEAGSNL
jgi:hypothetical protein